MISNTNPDVYTFDLTCGLTLGAVIILVGLLGMMKQPIDDVRDYLGEKIAFYFAWMAQYTRYLIILTMLAMIGLGLHGSQVVFDQVDIDAGYGTQSAVMKLIYGIIMALWTTFFAESWKRRNAGLAHIWDVTDFEEEESPRPEFLSNFYLSRHWKSTNKDKKFALINPMREAKGFYTADGRFIASDDPRAPMVKHFPLKYRYKVYLRSIPTLLTIAFTMIVGAVSLLVFKMLVGVSRDFTSRSFWGTAVGSRLPTIFSPMWITIMNTLYKGVAKSLNGLENYRTETEYEDALILKTTCFQFVNSYISLFYIAFIKASGVEMGALLGDAGIDRATGRPFRDICGTRVDWIPPADRTAEQAALMFAANVLPHCNLSSTDATTAIEAGCSFLFVERDCSYDLRVLLISYTLFKPCYEALSQLLPVLIRFIVSAARMSKSVAKHVAGSRVMRPVARVSRSVSKSVSKRVTGTLKRTQKGTDEQAAAARPVSISKEMATSSASGYSSFRMDAVLQVQTPQATPPPSPPPADATKDDAGQLPIEDAEQRLQRIQFHRTIEAERAQSRYQGTFSDYSTKVVQFGYVAMFSAAFPLAAICSAVANFNELRLDAIKVLSSRRPRYLGAQDIGSWQSVIAFISWAALPINVLIFVLTSWSLRTFILTPLIATEETCDVAMTTSRGDRLRSSFSGSHRAVFYGTNETVTAKCVQNILDCYSPIGGVEWLPAAGGWYDGEYRVGYLNHRFSATRRYTEDGLCNVIARTGYSLGATGSQSSTP